MARTAAARRAQWERECALKARSATFAAAERDCLRLLKEEGDVLYAYRCPVAADDPHYHIGHELAAHGLSSPPRSDQWTPKALRVRSLG